MRRENWWIVILLEALVLPVAFPLGFLIGFIEGFVGQWFGDLLVYLFAGIVLIVYILTPLAIYHDRDVVREKSNWTPSVFYYASIIPPLGYLLSTVYIIRRHIVLGIP